MEIKLYCLILFFCLAARPVLAQQDTTPVTWKGTAYMRKTSSSINTVKAGANKVNAASDSLLQALRSVSSKYIRQADHKITQYSNRLTNKTEKTLTKLSRWEEKIRLLVEQVNPAAAQKLFGPGQVTFTSLLNKLKEGKAIKDGYKAKFDQYRDQMSSTLQYMQEEKDKLNTKLAKPLTTVNAKMTELEDDIENSEALRQFIKERKKMLVDQAVRYIGNSKYLAKINKEAYYYAETLRNYKEIFSDSKKAEETAMRLLKKIPAFNKFLQQNSGVASLFRSGSNTAAMQSVAGLQTRTGLQSIVQERMGGNSIDLRQVVSRNMQQGMGELQQLKDKVLKAGAGSSDTELPDFKPNKQKTKTFLQRLEIGTNLNFGKVNRYMPAAADVALTVGYKLNDKSVIGVGANYKLGLGSIQRIRFTHQGIGFRSFVDWKLKKQFFVTGGFEMNHNAGFRNVTQLKDYNAWQQSGLVGITKKMKINNKKFKGTKVQLLYDFLHKQHTPVSQPVLFRIGYDLNR